MDDSDGDDTANLFQEPDGFYQEAKAPTKVSHQTLAQQTLTLNLVGNSPLWGHLLWNAGRTVADYLELNKHELVESKTILEFGAGAGLPSLICALNGAKQVVVTDYPDADLIENLGANILDCKLLPQPPEIVAAGYLWGAETSKLKSYLPDGEQGGFDLLILADLLFNHSEHAKLLTSVRETLKRSVDAKALVFFTPYRPWLLEKDLAFFDLARSEGFVVEKILEKVMEKVMFEEDPGVRSILDEISATAANPRHRTNC